jgi:hypothetical protein
MDNGHNGRGVERGRSNMRLGKLYNEELYAFFSSPNFIGMIKWSTI